VTRTARARAARAARERNFPPSVGTILYRVVPAFVRGTGNRPGTMPLVKRGRGHSAGDPSVD
jgi:hypothetical protein